MTTKTIKLNKSVKVGKVVYWNIVAFPCAAPFKQPTQVNDRPVTIACPIGTWVNPAGTNKNLTVICLAK